MNSSSSPGSIIFIDGPSSSGKTALARALQKQLDSPFIYFSFDLFRENEALPLEQIKDGTFSWPAMRPSFFSGIHRCLPALATAGNNLIFEQIIETKAWLSELQQLLAGLDVFFVGLHCSLAELERREIQRGNRRPGEARADLEIVHSFVSYDLELNSENVAEVNAKILMAAWEKRRPPSAFNHLAR